MKSKDKLATLCAHKAVAPSWHDLSRQKSYATKQQPFSIYCEKFRLGEFAYAKPQFGVIATSTFAGIGLALVLVGIFSVMAYTVALRTHEIGIRMALGAQHGNILTLVLQQGLRLITVGILIGVLASLGLMRFLASQIQGVSATDPLTFFAVVTLFLAVGLIAYLLPARRAAGIDPLVALRYE